MTVTLSSVEQQIPHFEPSLILVSKAIIASINKNELLLRIVKTLRNSRQSIFQNGVAPTECRAFVVDSRKERVIGSRMGARIQACLTLLVV